VKEDRTYLLHIQECIVRIEEDVRDGRAAFEASHMVQDAVIRNLQVLAESSKRLSDTLKAAHPEINWPGISGFRNLLVHDYFSVDLGIVWQVVAVDMPSLERAVFAMLAGNGGAPENI
jgi:uncharacterized protein with HEPN domain